MISAVVLTKNEEQIIDRCLTSLQWCDEIIVIDDDSTDRTLKIAEKNNARIYQHPLENDFSLQRNYALSKAKHDWVLFVDGDEIVSSSLQFEILGLLNNPLQEFVGFFIKRTDIVWGKSLAFGENGSVSLLRLGKKGSGKWVGTVHENWQIKGKTMTLKNQLEHYPHQTIARFLKDINFYTDLRAQELFEKKKKTNLFQITLFPLGKFVVNYFIRQGIRDGIVGMIMAIMMSFHSFLVRGKLWLLWQKK